MECIADTDFHAFSAAHAASQKFIFRQGTWWSDQKGIWYPGNTSGTCKERDEGTAGNCCNKAAPGKRHRCRLDRLFGKVEGNNVPGTFLKAVQANLKLSNISLKNITINSLES